MSSATDELRRLLDERGVEWDAFSVSNTEYTHWTDKDGHWCAASIGGPLSLHVNILSATPAQAIAATLGAVEYRKPTTLSQLEDENAKLRELMLDMLLYYAMPGAPDYKREAGLLERAHEMGVEVSE